MRKPFTREVQSAALLACKRKCVLCFGLDGDAAEKRGQLAHVDDRADTRLDNAVWLCRKHHDRYDTRSRQTKGYTPAEVREYRKQLIEFLRESTVWPDVASRVKTRRSRGVALDVFDRRVPTYRSTIQFLRYVCQVDNLELQVLLQFARDTDEAVFLFDDSLADYLASLYKRAMHLRAIGLILQAPERHTPALIVEQSNLGLWFTDQFEVVRQLFAPFLRVRDGG